MEKDMKVMDEELAAEVERAYTDAVSAEELLSDVYTLLSGVSTDSLKGDMKPNFDTFLYHIDKVRGDLAEIITEEKTLVERFLADIDAADDMLYGEG